MFSHKLNRLQQSCVFYSAEKKKNVPPLCVFGDSMVDNGNNVFLPNPETKFDFLPYGVDFCRLPYREIHQWNETSRFHGAAAYLPAARDPRSKGECILNGVNYAFGGSVILDSVPDIVREHIRQGNGSKK
ncbi:GDSL esterase/lipase At4g16230-like [Nymphaea colorata]|nr:GDSL esterase/lipase At4g16230-like [Nymphaea colorata]